MYLKNACAALLLPALLSIATSANAESELDRELSAALALTPDLQAGKAARGTQERC